MLRGQVLGGATASQPYLLKLQTRRSLVQEKENDNLMILVEQPDDREFIGFFDMFQVTHSFESPFSAFWPSIPLIAS